MGERIKCTEEIMKMRNTFIVLELRCDDARRLTERDDTKMRCFWKWWEGDVPKHAATNINTPNIYTHTQPNNEQKHKIRQIKMLAPEIWSTCGFSLRFACARARFFLRL